MSATPFKEDFPGGIKETEDTEMHGLKDAVEICSGVLPVAAPANHAPARDGSFAGSGSIRNCTERIQIMAIMVNN